MTVSYPSSELGPFFNLQLPLNSANLLNYSTLSMDTSGLHLFPGKIMIFSSSYRDLMASLSSFEMFGFGGCVFLSACLTFHLSSFAWVFGNFKATSSNGATKYKKTIHLMVMIKLRPLFSTKFSEVVSWHLLMLTMTYIAE